MATAPVYERRSTAGALFLTLLLTAGITLASLLLGAVLAGGDTAATYVFSLGGFLVANMLLVPKAYPPGKDRSYVAYAVFTILLAVVATAVLSWYTITKNRWIAAGIAPPTQDVDAAPSLFKNCPDCAEVIRAEANVCRFCGYRFAPNPQQ